MKFRIWTILWVFALLASALATFGSIGLVPTFLLLFLWALLFADRTFHARRSLVLVAAVTGVLIVILSAGQGVHRSALCAACMNNLKVLALGILNYESARGQLPAARQSLPDSNFDHTWRVWIHPFIESSTFYSTYRANEPWDSPANRKCIDQTQIDRWLYQCSEHKKPEERQTHYLAIVGEQTMWPPDRARTLSEISDGISNTILLIEAPHKNVIWAKPEDMSFDEAVELLTSSPISDYGHENSTGFFYKPTRGINVAFADGWAQLIELPIPKDQAIALLTIDGSEEVDRDNLTAMRQPELDYARIYSLSVFVLLSLLPTARLRKNRGSGRKLRN